jgi:hypothetical protein
MQEMQDNMQEHILRNAIITPDGTYLESFHRHDYKSHQDSLTGELYMVDGGYDYIRRSVNKVPAQDLTVTTLDPFTLQRRAFTWGSYGKMQDQEKHYIFLCDLSEEHICAILRTQDRLKGTYVEVLLEKELVYRKGEI